MSSAEIGVVDMSEKAPDSEVIRDAVMLASRAPSLHNSQPWRWVVEDARLHLWADPLRMMHATDHTGRIGPQVQPRVLDDPPPGLAVVQ